MKKTIIGSQAVGDSGYNLKETEEWWQNFGDTFVRGTKFLRLRNGDKLVAMEDIKLKRLRNGHILLEMKGTK